MVPQVDPLVGDRDPFGAEQGDLQLPRPDLES